jgi:hypothetical protein
VTEGSQRRRPPLFIGGEMQRSKFLNPTVKNWGHFGNSSGSLGNPHRGRHFLSPRFSILGFRWLRFASKQAPRHRGASVGGIRNQAFRTPNRETISVSQVQFERLNCETPRAYKSIFIFPIPSFDQDLSSTTE